MTNYAVLRAQQDLRGGEAGVSVIAHGGESLARRTDRSVPARARLRDGRELPESLRTTASTSWRGSSRRRA